MEENKFLDSIETQELIDEIKRRLNTLPIDPDSSTISKYPNGRIWLSTSGSSVSLNAKVNGTAHTLATEA